MGFLNYSIFCCALLCVHSSFAIILMGYFALVSFWCLVIITWLFFTVQWVCLQFAIVVFPDHTYLLDLVGKNLQLLSKIFIDSDFCHNYLHTLYLFESL